LTKRQPMPDSAIIRNYNKQLIFCALLMLPVAYLADCALDAVIFGEATLLQQIFHPSPHELAIRLLFSFFIVLISALAIHFLVKSTQLERALRKRNENLLLANQELESFNYALSHDLRNSLTIIYTSMEMLRDHFNISKSSQSHFLLSTISKYSEKMDAQIESMLTLASTTGRELHKEDIRLDELAGEIADALLDSQGSRRPDITIQDNLSLYGNKNLIRMTLENLLSNAIKFIPEGRDGEIEIGQMQLDGQTVYYVRDNGIGFKADQAEQIFEAFTRLPQTDMVPGTGIGLSTVRRIIKRHGGKVWAEGVPGQGATIYFTLPPAT